MNTSGYLAPGTKLKERYEIVKEVGRGGYSVVYQAIDLISSRPVAIKLLVPPPAIAPVARERLHREVIAVRSITSPYLVPVYDLLEDGPWTFIIMEFIAGGDLFQRVSQKGALSLEQTIRIGLEIGEVLHAAHTKGILHRDVKPQNVLIGEDGWARLTDFGSAKMAGQSTLTQTGAFVGTLDYTAPEVLDGKRADARSDIYSLGMMLYYAVTGNLPERSSAHLPPTPSETGHHPQNYQPGLPEWFDAIIARATTSEPSLRFPTMSRLLEALRQRSVAIASPAQTSANQCLLCRNTDPFGLWICPSCGGFISEESQSFILVDRPESRKEKKMQLEAMRQFLNIRTGRGLNEAAVGLKPLIKVSQSLNRRILERLRSHGIPARSVPTGRFWSLLPRDYWLLVFGTIVAGMAVGYLTRPHLLWLTPIISGILILGGWFFVTRTYLVTGKAKMFFPPQIHNTMIRTMSTLQSSSASSLLADLVAFSQHLYTQASSAELKGSVADLMDSFSDAALQLDHIEDALNRLESQRRKFTDVPENWAESMAQMERSRDYLVQKFLEAISLVGSNQPHAVLGSTGIGEQLSRITSDLHAEMEIQTAVRQQMQELMGPGDLG
jgi:serine/threonine protein kinase